MTSLRLHTDRMMGLLEEKGLILVDGHFDYGNGYHGTSYLTAQPLLADPAEVIAYAQDLADRIPTEIRDSVQIVAGPVTGGALFAFAMAVAIGGRRAFGSHHRVLFAPIYKDKSDGKLALREHYRKLIAGEFMQSGKKVLIVDDVCNTGLTLTRARKLVEDCGGEVVATAALYDRMSSVVKLNSHFSLATCTTDPGLIEASNCSLCKMKIPITRF